VKLSDISIPPHMYLSTQIWL